ncbi:hypothetical protein FHQ26_05015 [Testudinibacter sp. TR-2022]|uniref:dihydrofolate reductase family protein n=1 Tax=Testudinibacter sp. TR-2022 TaxID=2585029 RepID=UPI0011190366|nr:dihydrofolate reductase family protein [Testudinibacter sp. TR-2022]TNH02460.1 hypothetical protein FHQ22_09905 [Pasteurellaceae bacterium Phil31]TNH09884.1 hypothetical protein FHQ25_06885 [Testudinibacter sp. TR-2022]TNH10566.1 hypothetical protein FHQ26_05015 [Testudinibacter sp. TR-2022]TNH13637.1 hypothetical protein FIA56_06710 [Testudinibacter sp. TR-2022]TNH18155.1 hypothetical protein FHQ23_05705 [Testudinibacter sp. TR-2022]
MSKPYHLTCHMAVSIDGKVTGGFLEDPRFGDHDGDYFELFHQYNRSSRNWISGRVSMAQVITRHHTADTAAFAGQQVSRDDFVGDPAARRFAIAFDPDGKLSWTQNRIGDEYPALKGDHIIAILSESVADSYLLYLQSLGVSYVFAGTQKPLSMRTALDKLHRLFGLDDFLLVGGGYINGSFMQEGLNDTISLIQAPLVESRSVFQSDEGERPLPAYRFTEHELFGNGSLRLVYQKVGDGDDGVNADEPD